MTIRMRDMGGKPKGDLAAMLAKQHDFGLFAIDQGWRVALNDMTASLGLFILQECEATGYGEISFNPDCQTKLARLISRFNDWKKEHLQ